MGRGECGRRQAAAITLADPRSVAHRLDEWPSW
jgi:hypothetical protein